MGIHEIVDIILRENAGVFAAERYVLRVVFELLDSGFSLVLVHVRYVMDEIELDIV